MRLVGTLEVLFGVVVFGGCSSTPRPVPAVFTAEQLNAVAVPALEDDSAGPPMRPANTTPPAPPPPPPPARVRAIHASPDRGAASVDVYLGEAGTAGITALRFKNIAGPIDATGEVQVALRAAGAATTVAAVVSLTTPVLDADRQYTVIAHGIAGGRAPHALGLVLGADETTQPEAGHARARFFHGVVGLGAVDVCIPAVPARAPAAARPAVTVFANVAYGQFGNAGGSAYAEVTPSVAATLQMRAQNARPCTGVVRGTVTVTPPDRGVITTVAVGRVAGALPAGPVVPRELLVCPDVSEGAPSCTAVAIR